MENIHVAVEGEEVGVLFYEKAQNLYGFNYTNRFKPISLIMPYKNASYTWKHKLHPIFDMNMPEGYLFELFKKYLTKEYGYIDDFLIFSHIAPNIQSRLTFKSAVTQKEFFAFDKEEVLHDDSLDTFSRIVTRFLEKNAISGVQPKSLVLLNDKERLSTKEYILKTWGVEYPQLALNEYFCLLATQNAGIPTAQVTLSQNNHFLLVERFNYDKQSEKYLGFEEILALLGKNKEEKYSGSYELIAKVVYSVTTHKLASMRQLFALIVMNYLLRNGDAHLKNFGILYNDDFSHIWLAPAYDVVCTVLYFHTDKPALSMFGKRLWYGKKELVKFGVQHCYLKAEEAAHLYDGCILALQATVPHVQEARAQYSDFDVLGERMLAYWKVSMDEQTYKEVPFETL